jgi:hypothetical protein
LDDSRAQMQAAIQGLALDTPIHTDGGWRVQDILAHIAAWEDAGIKSAEAYKQGREYNVHDEFTGENTGEQFNQRENRRMASWTVEQKLAYYTETRIKLKLVLASLTPEQWAGQMRMAWGPLRPPRVLGLGMAGHEQEHLKLIREWHNSQDDQHTP